MKIYFLLDSALGLDDPWSKINCKKSKEIIQDQSLFLQTSAKELLLNALHQLLVEPTRLLPSSFTHCITLSQSVYPTLTGSPLYWRYFSLARITPGNLSSFGALPKARANSEVWMFRDIKAGVCQSHVATLNMQPITPSLTHFHRIWYKILHL